MKLANLQIDRFGARSQLSLREFSDGLNVIYGPNGAGKTTIIQFIRWMFFGLHDDASQPFLVTGDAPSGGSMTILETAGMRSFQRTNRSAGISDVVYPGTSEPASPPSTDVSVREFDRFFNVSFDRPHQLADLLGVARTHDFQLDYQQRHLERIQQLTEQIAQHRDELNRSPVVDGSRESLGRCREEKRHELDAFRLDCRRRRAELQRRRQPLAAELSDQHALVERLNGIVNRVNAAIATRREQLVEEHQQGLASREEEADRRHRCITELDGQIARWREILDEVRDRLDHVRRQFASLGKASDRVPNATDILCEELKYLSRCEPELSDLIEALQERRDGFGREFSSPGNAPGTMAVDYGLDDPQFTIAPNVAASLNDFRLRHLIDRRERATSQVNEAQVEFANRQRRLCEVEEELGPSVEDGRIAKLQREIDGIDAMPWPAHDRQTLQQTIISLEDEIRHLRAELGPSKIVDEAAAILARLTSNEYTSIGVIEGGGCHVTHRDGRVYDDTQLSRGVRDQVYLSLCLAIVSGYRSRQIELPVILNDIFINLDSLSTRALVHFLADFSREGHQILVFTRQEHILELFQQLAAKCFTLRHTDSYQTVSPSVAATTSSPSRHISAATIDVPTQAAPQRLVSELPPPPSPDPTYRWATERHREQSQPAAPDPPTVQPPFEPPQRDDVDPPSGEYGLQRISPLDDVPTLDKEILGYLHELGVHRVDAFLELDLERVESQLGLYGITAEIIQRRQREILMMLYVAATPLEAQLLVACGVPDPERLSRADEGVLLRRVETILERPEAASRFGTADQYSVERIRGWIQIAQGCAYRGHAPRSVLSDAIRSQSAPRATTKGRSRVTSKRTDSAPSKTAQTRDTVRLRPARELRFYLDPNDPVVSAPTIGPKTAERLQGVDIHLVADLLRADPDEVAARLNERRITRETILRWQLQAQLVCRVPNLRSHDAQILVACGVEDPEKLATLDAGNFFQQVTRFVETKEGQRILRNAKRPDLAEVTAWIQWSENARPLKAA